MRLSLEHILTHLRNMQKRPRGYQPYITDKHAGIRFTNLKNNQFEIRYMPGNPKSPWPAQKNPYVIHRTPKGYLDKNGKIIQDRTNPAVHIPIREYNYEKLRKVVPHD